MFTRLAAGASREASRQKQHGEKANREREPFQERLRVVDVPCHPVCKGQPEAIKLEQVTSLFAFLTLAGAAV